MSNIYRKIHEEGLAFQVGTSIYANGKPVAYYAFVSTNHESLARNYVMDTGRAYGKIYEIEKIVEDAYDDYKDKIEK